MKTIKIALNNKEKKYIQIYKHIKASILDGDLLPNEMLPSKRVLSLDLGLSINTILQAYNMLLLEGFIYSIEKKGYFVVNYSLKRNESHERNQIIESSNMFMYDLTTKNIDREAFPYKTLSKLYNTFNSCDEILNKSPNKGLEILRSTIAHNLFETKGVIINKDNIIIGSGVEYLLSIVITLFDNKSYILESPGYSKIKTILTNNNCNILSCPLDSEGLVIENIKEPYNIYTTPASEFPLGISMSMKRKVELINYARIHNTFIIEDDFDSEYKYLSTSTPLLSLDKTLTIYFKTFSRTIAPSFRLAYMVLPDSFINKYNEKYYTYSNTVSTLNQLVLNEFINGGGYYRHLNKTRILYKEKKQIIIDLLKDNEQLEIINSFGLLSILVKVKNTDIELFKKLLLKNKIEVSFISEKNYLNHLIIGYSSIPINDIELCINLLINSATQSLK